MTIKSSLNLVLVVISLFLFALLVNCGGQQSDQDTPDPETNSGGRVVVPDTEWEDPIAEEEPNEIENYSVGAHEGNSAPPTELIYEESTINIDLTIDGVPVPFDVPYEMYDDEEVEAVFHITATGAELARYYIQTASHYQLSQEGYLEGHDANVTFHFVYNSYIWAEEGGLKIVVVNSQNDSDIKELTILPIEIPGLHGN